MSVKDLFNSRANKIVTKQHVEQIADEVESKTYIEQGVKSREKFVPKINFSEPKYFARYGSAEKYYEDSIQYIFRTYPYDGSYSEKIKWHTDSTYLDNWFFETEYPRATGYVNFNENAVAADITVDGVNNDNTDAQDCNAVAASLPWITSPIESGVVMHPAGDPLGVLGGSAVCVPWFIEHENPQFVHIKGGPQQHIDKPYGSAAPDGKTDKLSELFPHKGGRANIWNDTEKYYEAIRESNLAMDPELGNTVEFWTSTDENPTTQVCLYDMFDGNDFTRLCIEHKPESISMIDGSMAPFKLFMVTYLIEGNGVIQQPIGNFDGSGSPESQTVSDPFSSAGWNHYAFVFSKNEAGNLLVGLFINGERNDILEFAVGGPEWQGGSLDNKGLVGLRANLNSYITTPAG